MPLLRRTTGSGESSGLRFKRPAAALDGEDAAAASDSVSSPTSASISRALSGLTLVKPATANVTSSSAMRTRSVLYPQAQPVAGADSASGSSMSENLRAMRLAKRALIDYHQPEPAAAAKTSARSAARPSDSTASGGDGLSDPSRSDALRTSPSPLLHTQAGANTVAENQNASTITAAAAADAVLTRAPEEQPDSLVPATVVVSRYPVSPYGRLYFQVEMEDSGATRHESVGLVIVDTEELGVMMYDRLGRQFGNRPEPGYPISETDVANACAGGRLRVGAKTVTLVTALTEESFRSGEFFLRSEHDMRIREDEAKAKAAAAAAAGGGGGGGSAKAKMTFGATLLGAGNSNHHLFAAQLFRRRPQEGQTGFTVPIAGRPKLNKQGVLEDLVPLHDPDRAEAVVLFRADYKRDVNGQRQVSVVVDPVVGDKLRPHQRMGVRFLFDCIIGERMPGYHGAILADEMGLGKTIQTIATVFTCLKQGKRGLPTARKCLIVTPSSLVKNWCNEFDKWLGAGAVRHFAISESTPKGDRIISRFDGDGDVLVISYDQLRKYVARLSKIRAIELVVCDEGHRLKNAEVKTTKAVDLIPTRNRIILSGTPIQNDLSEFHAMVGFVNPGILGNRDLFARVYEEPILLGRDPLSEEHVRSLGRDRAHYLATLTQRFILRRTQSINESYLPPKVDVTVFVRLGAMQEQTYENIARMVESATCTPLVLISALRKLCNHMDLVSDAIALSQRSRTASAATAAAEPDAASGTRRRNINHDNNTNNNIGLPASVLPREYRRGDLTQSSGSKIHFVSLVLDELRSNGERDKLVIVSNFTQTLDIIAALCKAKRVAYFQLDGSTPIKKRQELVDYFNVPGSQELVFLLSSKAGGVGLNLIGANRLILFDPDWNPANDAQAMGRVWRDGQKKRVFIYRLLSTGTIEEKIYQRQVSKQGLSANVVDMQEDSKQHFTLDELKSLFKYKRDTVCETHDLLSCVDCESAWALAMRCANAGGGSDRGGGSRRASSTQAPMKFRKVGEKKSGPRMDELKAWRHIVDVSNFVLDSVTRAVATRAPTLLSFLFADERDNTKKVIKPALTVDRPFASDEDAIICASQAAMEEHETEIAIDVIDSDVESASSDSDD